MRTCVRAYHFTRDETHTCIPYQEVRRERPGAGRAAGPPWGGGLNGARHTRVVHMRNLLGWLRLGWLKIP